MIFTISRKNMSQKLSLLLLVFGLIWGLMLLHYTFQQPRHQSSVKLREQILDLSKRYVKALAEENKNTVDVENGASMAGYADLKRTIAVLLDDILQRLVLLVVLCGTPPQHGLMSGATSTPRIRNSEALGCRSRTHELNHLAMGPAPY
uniref:Coiled-coil domain containing 126 n=2 Tax=Equus TaxID=9789 RepID=A0A9L0TL24_HORSE